MYPHPATTAPLEGFTPAVAAWFSRRVGTPTEPQARAWPLIRAGLHTLVAAPTGSGKTLAGFLAAIDSLLREGEALADETRVVYVSPLRALSNDVQKNLQGPLAELQQEAPGLPAIRVEVRTGDTPAARRSAMSRKPPHLLVTTPESLYLMLTSAGGREMLRTVRCVIVDEIHALVRDKRGAHLALSLERLEALTGRPVQRIGLSATQRPVETIGEFLVGVGRTCAVVDAGAFRALDLEVEVPPSPLSTVCSHEQWAELIARIAQLVEAHRTTLIFVNTRKLAERVSAQLSRVLGEEQVTSHHGSLSRDRRLNAEQRLKSGALRALVATASLELGIDIGDVDLVVQVGSVRSVATLLQRVGRAGHSLSRLPRGRVFPLTLDELAEAAALLRCVREGQLDKAVIPEGALDILAQQLVAECVTGTQDEGELYERLRVAHPYRALTRATFDELLRLHGDGGRRALLHRDGVYGRVRATPRARLTALRSGGAIPDTADYQVVLEPEGTPVGSVNEDWAIESSAGDIFQLGNTSWRIARVSQGVVRVTDAHGQPPSLPFWLGEAPGRSRELSEALASFREELTRDLPPGPVGELATRRAIDLAGDGLCVGGAQQLAEYVLAGRAALGTVPTQRRVVLERFFDESGGTQLVVHAPFGSRINRAWGLALRKRFCVGFGFELQAAANEEAIILSLGLQHSFVLDDVFDFLSSATARDVLVQALLAAPMFTTRWRWNTQRALMLERTQSDGRRLPAPLARMRAEDLLVAAFPEVVACPETLPGGPLPVPDNHPIVRQTIDDCLNEAMDVAGFLEVLDGLASGVIERVAVDTATPSAFARGILNSAPYTFLDGAPLEERRTQAVITRRILDVQVADDLGALDPAAVARVKAEAWPAPADAEDLHEALLWMGYVTEAESAPWHAHVEALEAAGRVVWVLGLCYATEVARSPARMEPRALLRGRVEALGPIPIQPDHPDHEHLLWLEAQGVVLRTRFGGGAVWCERRLLARIHRYTLETLRREIEPVSLGDFQRFVRAWQHVDHGHQLEGPDGVRAVIEQLAGVEIPAAAWESAVLPSRVRGFVPAWLDQVTLTGGAAFARLWGAATTPVARTPIALVPREELPRWLALGSEVERPTLGHLAEAVQRALEGRGASFFGELCRLTHLDPDGVAEGLGELVASGRVTCDSFGGLRALLGARDPRAVASAGRWSLLRDSRPTDLLTPGAESTFHAALPSDGGGTTPAAGLTLAYPGRPSPRGRPAPTGSPGAEIGASLASPLEPQREAQAEFLARQLLQRTGVVCRRTAARERLPLPYRELVRALRRLELRGEIRGGRFVAGIDGEQFALPEAIALMRRLRRQAAPPQGAQRSPGERPSDGPAPGLEVWPQAIPLERPMDPSDPLYGFLLESEPATPLPVA